MDRKEMGLFSNNIAIGSNMLISHAVDIAHWLALDPGRFSTATHVSWR